METRGVFSSDFATAGKGKNGEGQWSVGSGQWSVGSGQWAVGSGQWAVGGGQCTQSSLWEGEAAAEPKGVGIA
jgi:hypothetical protein